MSELKVIVAERLTELLRQQDFSQADLARESGVSKSTISKAINKEGLSVNMAKQISKTLGVSLDYLYGNSPVGSLPQYALDTMAKHLSAYNSKSIWGNNLTISTISISQPLSEYLEAVFEASKPNVPDYVRKSWLQKEKEKFLQLIDNDTEHKVEFALIKHVFLTEKVLDQIAADKDEMQGEIK